MEESFLYLFALGFLFLLWELVKLLVGKEAFEPAQLEEPISKAFTPAATSLAHVHWREMMLGVGVGDAFGVGM